jgi:hypothetical protein
MQDVLESLTQVSGVRGSLLVGRDGMIIASDLPQEISDDRVAAVTGAIAATVQDSLAKLDRGPLMHAQIDAEDGKVFLQEAGRGLLVVLAQREVNTGLIRLEMKAAVDELRRRLRAA